MEERIETADSHESVSVLDFADLGDALAETKQVLLVPLVVDNLLGFGLPA